MAVVLSYSTRLRVADGTHAPGVVSIGVPVFRGKSEFTFWKREEFERLIRDAGFRELAVSDAFGNPPQAFVVSAVR